MKTADVKIGGTYSANVSGAHTTVRIETERVGGGWFATNLGTGKRVTIKTARRLTPSRLSGYKNAAIFKPIEKKAKTTKTTPDAKPTATKKLGALSAALKVLTEAGEPMNAVSLIEAMSTKGLWTSPGGKTPHATLYAAIVREIQTKGADARFKKTDRGLFATR